MVSTHKPSNKPTRADVTPKAAFINRRRIMAGAAGLGLAGAAGLGVRSFSGPAAAQAPAMGAPNSLEQISGYCNFYEFGTGKDDPARYAHQLSTEGWTVQIDGLVDRPGTYDLAELIDGIDIEERIYRFRCVEAWSMVIPWNGFELNRLLDRLGVQSKARYVAFETALRPDEMPGVKRAVLDWPYVEGLRLDEAMHPLTLLATGLYGEALPKQNGAPLRLVVPWKYGFKSIKSIVRISLTEDEPPTSWNRANPREYGFYSNVNPNVSHPRWSQARERVIGGGLFAPKVDTLMFNGYEDEVAHLYEGMDLETYF